ncbi:gp436 family protein [Chelatococcus asaccharovorans]|uniref:Phage gp36-like protein n=1 Tax=Chelatococcus asaccharovorans TaxID=28210 RepID=A0A2V3UDQ7_9HYPH|nr:DUF1320 domain-containing protein [Chelatococcus asaccharovorans]MBS7703313.1 DUF1320 domain-containing protein [Chelatococcus asaccharovorans]PXW61646.1 phage gp36-like protein [Chelatococcus asaccharovorans]
MPYALSADIDALYGEDLLKVIADRDRSGTVDQPSVDRALQEATGEIDAYISQRYAVPVSPVPTVLRRVCVDMAVYYLAGETGATITLEISRRYERALSFLKDVAKGTATLGSTEGEGDPPTFGPVPTLGTFGEAVRA